MGLFFLNQINKTKIKNKKEKIKTIFKIMFENKL